MTLVILYFAAIRELLGTSEETLEVGRGSVCTIGGVFTIGDLAARLVDLHPELQGHLASVRFALNESFVDTAASLVDGDTVALIPPVSGG
jgi:molybdopterin converting factor subunit 1